MNNSDIIRTGRCSQDEARALFDALPPISAADLPGTWRGRELFCGHPLEGLLTNCGWYGKRFASFGEVYPQLFARADGSLFMTNPRRMPMNVALNRLPAKVVRALFALSYPWVVTHKSHAHLITQEYHGVCGAAMAYDGLPVVDIFRGADGCAPLSPTPLESENPPVISAASCHTGVNTLLGLMLDTRDRSGKSLYFILERVKAPL
jgi:hypothetical protein